LGIILLAVNKFKDSIYFAQVLMKKLLLPILLVNLALLQANSTAFAQEKNAAKEGAKNADAEKAQPKKKKKKEAKPYISIAKPDIKNVSDLQKRLIIRSAIGVVMKSGKYNMLFSSPKSFEDAKFKFYKLVMEGSKTKWGKNKVGYNLKFKLVDAYTKEVLRETIKTRIEGRHLVFKAKLLQWELIFGKDKAEALEKEIEAQTEEELKEEEVKDPKDKDNKNNDGASASGEGKPGDVAPFDPQVAEINVKDKKKKKKPEDEEEEEEKEKKKKKKKLTIAEFDSPDLDLTKERLDTTVKPPKPFKVDSQIAFGLDFISETISSKSIIEVDNEIGMMGVYVDAALQFQENPTDRLHVGFRMTRITSENDYALTPPRMLHLRYKLGFVGIPIYFHAGFEFETQPFAQLGEAGEGIQAWEQSFLWYKGGLSLEFKSILRMKTEIGGFIFSPFVAATNFGTENGEGKVTLTGSKFEVYMIQQIWGNYNLKFGYYQSDITSQGLNTLQNQQATTLISLLYR
jgi:hypothetical protein